MIDRLEQKIDACLDRIGEVRAEQSYHRAKLEDLEREMFNARKDFARKLRAHAEDDEAASQRVGALEQWRAKAEGVKIGVVLVSSAVGGAAAWLAEQLLSR